MSCLGFWSSGPTFIRLIDPKGPLESRPSTLLAKPVPRFLSAPTTTTMAAAATPFLATPPSSNKIHSPSSSSVFFSSTLRLPLRTSTTLHSPTPFLSLHYATSPRVKRLISSAASSDDGGSSSTDAPVFHGPCYVVSNNIDTDQIIPAEYLTLVPSKPDEYRKLGALAMIGLPSALYPIPFIEPNTSTTRYPIVIAGANFGCGSSREHAPVALGAAGVRAVVAESYARIFFRNSVATGEVYPVESDVEGLCKECTTGDVVTVDLQESKLVNHTTGKEYGLKPIGDAGPVVEAGGIFAYARKTGMISSDVAA